MTHCYVLLVIAPDRPGLVRLLSDTVAKHGGNWLESRMARLSGQFAGILRVTVPTDQSGALSGALAELRAEGLDVTVHEADALPESGERQVAVLELVGTDRPGIVQRISQSLADMEVNLDELHTEVSTAPMSGETLFRAHAELRMPRGLDPQDLRIALEAIAGDLIVDIQLHEDRDG